VSISVEPLLSLRPYHCTWHPGPTYALLFALATAWRIPFASAALPSPEGEVELDYVVGKGAYGHVHRALLAKTGQTVAVKVVFLNGKSRRRTSPSPPRQLLVGWLSLAWSSHPFIVHRSKSVETVVFILSEGPCRVCGGRQQFRHTISTIDFDWRLAVPDSAPTRCESQVSKTKRMKWHSRWKCFPGSRSMSTLPASSAHIVAQRPRPVIRVLVFLASCHCHTCCSAEIRNQYPYDGETLCLTIA
jgi:hypothetical protein